MFNSIISFIPCIFTQGAEGVSSLGGTLVCPHLPLVWLVGWFVGRSQVKLANAKRIRIRTYMMELLGEDAVLAVPTTPGPAPPVNTPPVGVGAAACHKLSF